VPRPRATEPTFSLTQRGGKYYVQWWDGNRSQRVSCRTESLAEAQRFLAEFKAGAVHKPAPEVITVGKILDGYRGERELKPHSPTLAYSCPTLKRHLGNLPVELLTKDQVRGYVSTRRKEGPQGASAKHRRPSVSCPMEP
jgi:hypothetical protein